MAEQTATREIAARRAYDTWRWHYDHVTRWNELFPGAQVLWLNVADAVLSANRTEPDWADLREMARNAGLIRSADYDPRENRYGHRDEDGYLKDGLGWILQEWRGRDRRRLRVDLVGPIDGVRRTATLVDPSPAEVLTAARLVGLIGGTS